MRGGSVSVAPESGAGKSPESDKGENADAAQVGTAAFGAAPGAAEMGAMAVRVVSGAAALAARLNYFICNINTTMAIDFNHFFSCKSSFPTIDIN